ncbi:hypothetical protein [Azospirillum argentinense]|nr:hypothetical protein [Azospirillum argentinense]
MASLQGSWRITKKIARWGFPALTYKPGTVVMRVLGPSLERHMGGRQALIAYTLAVALAVLWTLGLGVAFAATALDSAGGNAVASLISQPQDALALRWLRDLFGPVSVLQGGVSGDSTATVLTGILAHINAATMAIGGILLLYGLFVAVAQTATRASRWASAFPVCGCRSACRWASPC